MAINPLNGKTNDIGYININKPKNQATDTPSQQTGVTSDAATVTQDLKKALAVASAASVIDSNKIATVKEALQNGQYRIDADSIADKMLQIDRPLYGMES